MPGPQPADCIPLTVRIVGRGLDPSAAARGLAALLSANICRPAGCRETAPIILRKPYNIILKDYPMKIAIISLGCPKNQVDADVSATPSLKGRPHHRG